MTMPTNTPSSTDGIGFASEHPKYTATDPDPFSRTWLHPFTSFIGFGTPGKTVEAYPDQSEGWGYTGHYALLCATCLLVTSLGIYGLRHNQEWSIVPLFWIGILVVLGFAAIRLTVANVPRNECMATVVLTGMTIHGVKILHSPMGFTHFDEFLHWVTAEDILENHHLFSFNSLLPVSSVYPALEILTTALANLSGLSLFMSGTLVIGLSRFLFLLGLFLLFERFVRSPRIAAIALTVYIGGTNFALFHSQFAYESLAISFLVLILLSDLSAEQGQLREQKFGWLFPYFFMATLAVTHHLSAYIATALLGLLAMVDVISGRNKWRCKQIISLAIFAAVVSIGWNKAMHASVSNYLGPVLQNGLEEISALFSFNAVGRQLFVSSDGTSAPMWQRIAGIFALFAVCLGLLTGFLRTLTQAGSTIALPQEWRNITSTLTSENSRLFLFGILTLGFPICMILRLTSTGWEIGNRLASFVFLGVAIVIAIAIAQFWSQSSAKKTQAVTIGLVLTAMIFGGIVVQWGPITTSSFKYRVSADTLSVESMGIDTAKWTKDWLGDGNRFATDRINRLLLASYGRQRPITTLGDEIDISSALFSPSIGNYEATALEHAFTDYILIDLRLTTALPVQGVYFEGGESDIIHAQPPLRADLTKFDELPKVSRVFDNGALIIYDIRSFHDR